MRRVKMIDSYKQGQDVHNYATDTEPSNLMHFVFPFALLHQYTNRGQNVSYNLFFFILYYSIDK